MHSREVKLLTRGLTTLAGSILAIVTGLVALQHLFAEPLARLSYDLHFIAQPPRETGEIVLVYLDDDSARKLKQPLDDAWNRALHIQLLDRLAHDEVRLVMFDVVFDAPAQDAAADEAF